MNLHWKVEMAHLISPGWRPYPDREAPHTDTATPGEEVRMGIPEQRIALAPAAETLQVLLWKKTDGSMRPLCTVQ